MIGNGIGIPFQRKSGGAAPERLYALFFDGVNDYIEKNPGVNYDDDNLRFICTFPSDIGNDQQFIALSSLQISATFRCTLDGDNDLAIQRGSSAGRGLSANSGLAIGQVLNISRGDNDLHDFFLDGNLLPDINNRSRLAGSSVDRFGLRESSSNFPYRGVLIELDDNDGVNNDDNNWGNWDINGAQRVYTDNPNDPIPNWFFADNDQPVTL